MLWKGDYLFLKFYTRSWEMVENAPTWAGSGDQVFFDLGMHCGIAQAAHLRGLPQGSQVIPGHSCSG